MVGQDEGWASVPPSRKSTFARPEYKQAVPFGEFVLKAIESADPNDSSLKRVPYSGIQFVAIPEFPSFGSVVGQAIAGFVAGQTSVDAALKAGNAAADRAVKQAGYQK
ncbi:periplasmic ABC transporter substrate-binding component [Caballeronia arvi]|uniref:Periplasmic ABC transporter substrate-binding component n=1 Tax=Caballeronia arvi TaxID=1777135 RepID=A0A158L5W7_9BURK|nr:periplasmic ABC transporter substrate-binding component [Caballeronia arvi]